MRALPLMALFALVPWMAMASGESEELRTDTFRYERVERVQILGAEIYDVEITGMSGHELAAEVVAPVHSRVGIEHRRSGETVMIRAYSRRQAPWLGRGPHKLQLTVPEDCELDLKTSTGSITVSGVIGAKRIETDTGKITVLESSGATAVTTNTGTLSLSSIDGDLALRANTGGVSLANVKGTMEVQTDTGRIEASGLFLTGHSSFTADTGSITLELAQSLDDFSFQLRSDTGRIVLGDSETRGRLLVGRGPIHLRVETDTGAVHVSGR